jgi:hypothetical protein
MVGASPTVGVAAASYVVGEANWVVIFSSRDRVGSY